MITTTHGTMDESTLKLIEPEPVDDEREHTTVVEYWMQRSDLCPVPGHDVSIPNIMGTGYLERVHRSVHVTLKRMPSMASEAGGLG